MFSLQIRLHSKQPNPFCKFGGQIRGFGAPHQVVLHKTSFPNSSWNFSLGGGGDGLQQKQPVTHPFRTSFYRIPFFVSVSTWTTVHCCCPQLDTLAAALLHSRCLRSLEPLAPTKTDGSSHPEAVLLRLKFAASPPKRGQPQVLCRAGAASTRQNDQSEPQSSSVGRTGAPWCPFPTVLSESGVPGAGQHSCLGRGGRRRLNQICIKNRYLSIFFSVFSGSTIGHYSLSSMLVFMCKIQLKHHPF